jgi:hypothetical protein
MIDDATILTNMQANSAAKSMLGIHGITQPQWERRHDHALWLESPKQVVDYVLARGVQRGNWGDESDVPAEARLLPESAACFLRVQFLAGRSDELIAGGQRHSGSAERRRCLATFMRFLDQPTPSTTEPGGAPSIANGRQNFINAGCALCHTPSMTTGNSSFTVNAPGLSRVQANLFSDLLLHHMGAGLHDGISQGNAGPDQFRTAPLWGLGQRVFFLHDGRTSDLLETIKQHASPGSEANGVIHRFNRLTDREKQDLINFLRSL